MKTILFVVGTRPEIIKTAPVILALEGAPGCRVRLCFSGQHQAMALQMIGEFGLHVDDDLKVMKPRQDLAHVTSATLFRLMDVCRRRRPDLVVVQGDTTTAFAASLAAFYRRIPVAHIEAGLRTGDKHQPYPEELNRVMIGRVADLDFAPTAEARNNLLREGVARSRVAVTGNTAIDALLHIREQRAVFSSRRLRSLPWDRRVILVTAHRKENQGAPLRDVCRALAAVVEANPDVSVVYPVHLNPAIRGPVRAALAGRERIHLVRPAGYADFVRMMDRACLILTDSGGIQEEAPSLGKPVLILRNKTERPEVVRAGCAKIVGTDPERIVRACNRLLRDKGAYRRMARRRNPVGDGKAAARIAKRIGKFLQGME